MNLFMNCFLVVFKFIDPYMEFICQFIFMYAGVGATASALDEDGVLEIDTSVSLETTWHAMEELVSMGLVRSIGIR